MKKPSAPKLYPEIPQIEGQEEIPGEFLGAQFRLDKISEIRNFLESEASARDKLRRRYKTVWNIFYNLTQILGLVAVGSGAGAVGTLATGIGAVVSIPLGGLAVAGGIVSTVSVALGKATMKKLEKHESIKRTAESSLNTVNDLVSQSQ